MSRMGEQMIDLMNEDEYDPCLQQAMEEQEKWYESMDSNKAWIADYELKLKELDMKISQLSEGKYLKKDDVEPPIKVKIESISQENLAQEGQPVEMKYVLHFTEGKPLVLNMTNGQLISIALGSEETDDWVGSEIVLFNDPSVSFGGKLTGGVRARAVKGTKSEDMNDDIPF